MSYFRPALLRTESGEDFEKLFDELKRDVQPATFVELMYVSDIANRTWDIIRYRRDKAGIINNAFHKALANILRRILLPPGPADNPYPQQVHLKAQQLAWDWSFSQESKDRVSALLEEAELDLWAVEAEALRLSLDDIERVDRLLTAAEARRDTALRSIAWCRESFVKKLQQSSDRLLDEDGVPSIAPSGAET